MCILTTTKIDNKNDPAKKAISRVFFIGSHVQVRAELAVAIQWYIVDFETRFTDLYARLNKKAVENEPVCLRV